MANYGSMYSGLGGRRSREHPDETVQRRWHSDMKKQQQKNLSWKQDRPQLGEAGPDPSWNTGTGSVASAYDQLGNYGTQGERQIPQSLRDAAANHRNSGLPVQKPAAKPLQGRRMKTQLRSARYRPQKFRPHFKRKNQERAMNKLGVK